MMSPITAGLELQQNVFQGIVLQQNGNIFSVDSVDYCNAMVSEA